MKPIHRRKIFGKQYVWLLIGWCEDDWYNIQDKVRTICDYWGACSKLPSLSASSLIRQLRAYRFEFFVCTSGSQLYHGRTETSSRGTHHHRGAHALQGGEQNNIGNGKIHTFRTGPTQRSQRVLRFPALFKFPLFFFRVPQSIFFSSPIMPPMTSTISRLLGLSWIATSRFSRKTITPMDDGPKVSRFVRRQALCVREPIDCEMGESNPNLKKLIS